MQRASGHYLQRVDQPTIRLDPTRRTLGGAQITGSFNKIAGRHWLWGSNIMIESPEFDPLDFGRLNYAGDYTANPRITYRETRPGRLFRSYSFSANVNNYWYFDTDLGVRQHARRQRQPHVPQFLVDVVQRQPVLARPGRAADARRSGDADAARARACRPRCATAAARRRAGTGTCRCARTSSAIARWSVNGSVSARPSPSLQFSVAPEYIVENGPTSFSGPINRQYVTTLAGGRPETYGRRYIFGLIDRTTLSTQFRVSYTFKPDVNLDVYVEPFAASGLYSGFGELAVAREPRPADVRHRRDDHSSACPNGSWQVTDGAASFTLSNRDFNLRSFQSNVVLRWEWRPGSMLYLVGSRAAEGPSQRSPRSASAISSARCRRPAITYWR